MEIKMIVESCFIYQTQETYVILYYIEETKKDSSPLSMLTRHVTGIFWFALPNALSLHDNKNKS